VGVYSFLSDQLPFGYAYNFDNFLFNKIQHINFQEVKERADYFLVNNVKKRIEGKIHFLLKDSVAHSPYRSLFGSFEFNPKLQTSLLADFTRFIEDDLGSRKIQKIRIVHPAECYSEIKAKKTEEALTRVGFQCIHQAVNHHITVDDVPLIEKIHLMEQRKLKKATNKNLQFVNEPEENADEVYEYITKCRSEQGLIPSINKAALHEYLEVFPQNYYLFTVRKGKEILAATVAVKVSRKILYNFLPANLKKFNALSPMVMLLDGLYQWASEANYEMIDLGISTLRDMRPQNDLITFKERMGGILSYKNTFEKVLK
jgi:hypothetical protein